MGFLRISESRNRENFKNLINPSADFFGLDQPNRWRMKAVCLLEKTAFKMNGEYRRVYRDAFSLN